MYDTAWQMFARATPAQADEYFEELKTRGFSGAWVTVIGHAPARYNDQYPGGGLIGSYTNGEIVLSPGYITHVNQILDKANTHGMKVGLVVAWQNLYLPGGQSDAHVPSSDLVRETLTTANADAYGRQMVDAFGSHPALSSWVFGGDGGTNNTAANIAVWDIMADAIRDEGSTLDIGIHLPPYEFDSLLYADVDFLDFAAPEIGHNKTPAQAQFEMEQAVAAYDIPVWMGEARYFNNDFKWLPVQWRNPGAVEMAEDAQASKNAGVGGYLYGDAGRWNWCAGYGDTTPCDPTNIADSFGPGEDAALGVFENPNTPPTTTTTTTTTAAPTTTTTTTTTTAPAEVMCDGRVATIVGTVGDDDIVGTSGPDVIAALQGNDTIRGLAGDDVICGGKGNDLIIGGQGFDTLFGAQGNDVIYSANGEGTTASEALSDSRGARIFAGAGNDTIVGSDRWDRIQGGPGRDHLLGFKGNDWLRGGGGDDIIVGHEGSDDLYGGAGSDVVDGDFRDSKVRGGPGNDACIAPTPNHKWRGCTRTINTDVPAPTLPFGNVWMD